MRRFLLFWVLLIPLLGLSAQLTTTYGNERSIKNDDEIVTLKKIDRYNDYTLVTIQLVPTKNRKRMNYFYSPHTYIQANELRLPLEGSLGADGKFHSCTYEDGWGWSDVKRGETYSFTLGFKGNLPEGIHNFSLIDDYEAYHGYSFRNHEIKSKKVYRTDANEEWLKQHIDKSSSDPLLGIYEGLDRNGYRLAFIKHEGYYTLIYIGEKEPKSWWLTGDIKAILEPSATYGLFKGSWFTSRKQITNEVLVAFDGHTMKTMIDGNESNYLKMYPVSNAYGADETQPRQWSGTGFALRNGYIATNHHVVDQAKQIRVHGIRGNHQTSYAAEVVATDKGNDLALLRVSDSQFTGFGSIPYNLNTRVAEVGEDIFVLGYPLTTTMGNEVKLTTGIISSRTGFQGDVSLYQISAPIQPGNSGGPLFDHNGELVGIVNAKHKGAENVNYAIKTPYLKTLVESVTSVDILPNQNLVRGQMLTDQVKQLKNFVYHLTCTNQGDGKGGAAAGSYTQKPTVRKVVKTPNIARNMGKKIYIRNVVLSDNATVVEFIIDNQVNDNYYQWYTIDKESTYLGAGGKRYPLLDTEGVATAPNVTYFRFVGENRIFRLYFPPIPSSVTSIDVVEDTTGDWKFYGVDISPEE